MRLSPMAKRGGDARRELKMNRFEDIIRKSNSLDALSRDMVAFFSTNDTLSRYKKAFEREEIRRKLEEIIAEYKTHLH